MNCNNEQPVSELIHELPRSLLRWMNFRAGANAALIASDADYDRIMGKCLTEMGLKLTFFSEPQLNAQIEKGVFDYVLIGQALEYGKGSGDAQNILNSARRLLKSGGKLLLALENRLAIRYFCGDADPGTGIIFDGIDNYPIAVRKSPYEQIRLLFDRAEITDLLEAAGFIYHKFYSVFPDLISPQILLADGTIPTEELDMRIFPAYHRADSVFLLEEKLYSSLLRNRLFHPMANAFFVECAFDRDGETSFEHADQITLSMNRGKWRALATIVNNDTQVVKKPLHVDAFPVLEDIYRNTSQLKKRGIPVSEVELREGSLVSEYIKGVSVRSFLRELLAQDLEAFIAYMDRFWNLILQSSEIMPYAEVDWEAIDPWWPELEKKGIAQDKGFWRRIALDEGREEPALGPILREGFIDLVILNAIMTDKGPVFFDQEFSIPQLPARVIMLKNIDLLYRDASLQKIYPARKLYDRYGITEFEEFYRVIEFHFWTKLVNFDPLAEFRATRERNSGVVEMNRFCMSQPWRVRSALMTDIFADAADKELYVFGAGHWAEKFIAMYRHDFKIAGIVDNDPKKQGRLMYGFTVQNPEILRSLDANQTKVIICVKHCDQIVRQMLAWGINNVGIYNAWMAYPLHRNLPSLHNDNGMQKKYHLGYVAGVFDLFHYGHLELLRRAKEQCQYLIVGVVTDEGVRRNKHIEPVIPFEERLAVVQACRYVDEAVEIPLNYCDTQDAWRKFQFDVQFSGSDYEHDPFWLEKQRFLRTHGADLVFFPYTEATSSTKIKNKISDLYNVK